MLCWNRGHSADFEAAMPVEDERWWRDGWRHWKSRCNGEGWRYCSTCESSSCPDCPPCCAQSKLNANAGERKHAPLVLSKDLRFVSKGEVRI